MSKVQRIFIPGSEWLYIKIYCGNNTAEKLLSNAIPDIINRLNKQQWITKWFFIRYADPNPHIRIRFLIKEKRYWGEILDLFYKKLNPYVKDNSVWKIQTDTYNRELERYGNTLIEEAESIFYIDSECTLSIIKKLSCFQKENYRWMIALKMIDCFLSDFSFDNSTKQKLMNTMAESYKKEFGFNMYNSKQFNAKFRENKNAIESVLHNTIIEKDFLSLHTFIKRRSKKIAQIIEQLNNNLEKYKSEINQSKLIISYIHMMLNRLFRSRNRQYELILYDFMYRYYTSEIARQKYNSNK